VTAGRLVLLAALLSACAPRIEETVLPARIDYQCAGNRVLPVARGDGRTAVIFLEGREVVLRRAESAAQEKYSDGGLALYLDGERAMREREGVVLLGPCNTPTSLPTAPRYNR
jgi:membrane-bound inhibitor of C-type lysozyme